MKGGDALDIQRTIKMAIVYGNSTQTKVAGEMGTTKANLSQKIAGGNKIRVLDLEAIANALGAELRITFEFPDGTSIG